jgi:hypothetical protein
MYRLLGYADCLRSKQGRTTTKVVGSSTVFGMVPRDQTSVSSVTSSNLEHHFARGVEVPLGVNLGRPNLAVAQDSLSGVQSKTTADASGD